MKWIVLLSLFILTACNSKEPGLSSLAGIGSSSSTAPSIIQVSFPLSKTYLSGETLSFGIKFSKPVEVQGAPKLTLIAGTTLVQVNYVSGSGSETLVFEYVANNVSDDDGIQLSQVISLNGGSIFDPLTDEDAIVTFNAVSTSGILINASTASIIAITPALNRAYSPGQTIRFNVTFSEKVCAINNVRLPLTVNSNLKYADRVVEGCGTIMKFDYVVQAGDTDTDGVDLANVSLNLSMGPAAVNDAFGESASVNYSSIPSHFAGVTISASVPPLEQPRTVPADGTLKIGDHLEVTLNFNEPITVSGGTPHIAATIGGTSRTLIYSSGSGTSSLVFRYTIVEGDLDTDGITLGTLSYNGSSIRDGEGNSVPQTQSWPSTSNVKVDGVRPTIASMTTPINAIYRPGATLSYLVTWSEHVNFSGPYPQVEMTFESTSTSKKADSTTNDGNVTTYTYIVQNGDADFNGIGLTTTNLKMTAPGKITDDAGNEMTNFSYGTHTTSGIKVVPTEVNHWYDPTNPATTGTSTGTVLSEFKDLIGSKNGTVGSGIGWNGSPKRVDFAANDITFGASPIPTFEYMALVLTVKSNPTGPIVFATDPQIYLEMDGGYSVGSSCSNCAQFYNGSAWVQTNTSTGDFGTTHPGIGQKKIIFIKYPSKTNVDLILNAYNGWYLNELFLLSGTGVQSFSSEIWRAILLKHNSAAAPN